MTNTICALAVIVLFEPDDEVFRRVAEIAAQVERLVLVDNSPLENVPRPLGQTSEYIFNGNRGGLAGALNLALGRARAGDYTHLFVFDQDTDVYPDYCKQILEVSMRLGSSPVGIFGPSHINSSTGHPVRLSVPAGFLQSVWPSKSDRAIECLFVINSCSLLDLRVLPLNIAYDENLGIDMVDVDFGLKLRSIGILSVCIPSCSVVHGIGNRRKGSFAFSPTNYNSYRKYLQTRNRFVVWRRHYKNFAAFVLSDVVIWIMDCVRTVLFERGRIAKMSAIGRGVYHGLFGE